MQRIERKQYEREKNCLSKMRSKEKERELSKKWFVRYCLRTSIDERMTARKNQSKRRVIVRKRNKQERHKSMSIRASIDLWQLSNWFYIKTKNSFNEYTIDVHLNFFCVTTLLHSHVSVEKIRNIPKDAYERILFYSGTWNVGD